MRPPSRSDRAFRAVPAGGASLDLAAARYDILLPVASGGMATVYLAQGREPGMGQVALKIPHAFLADITDFRLELLEEARLAVQIRHPSVVAVLDAGEGEEGLYLAMEYVEGDTLAALVKESSEAGLPLGVGMRVLLDALAGLHAAHELRDAWGGLAGVVHRDFSPQNILIGLDGMAKLTDFGVAKAATRLSNTRTGAIKGKVAYMAPEQARGLELDRRCDVWAAGVIAWELIAGRRLYSSDNDAATLLTIVTEEPPPLWSVRADVPRPLADAVAFALRMDLEARCPDAATLAAALAAGCRAGGIRVADAAEVGAHVAALVGAKIARRRAEAAERLAAIRADRAPAGGVAQAGPEMQADVPTTPLAPPVADVATATLPLATALGGEGARSSAVPAAPVVPLQGATPMLTTAFEPPAEAPARRSAGVWLLGLAAALAAVAGAGVWAAGGERAEAPAAARGGTALAADALAAKIRGAHAETRPAAAPATTPEPPADAAPVAEAAASAAQAAPAAGTAPPAAAGAAHARPAAAASQRPARSGAASSRPPTLAPSPYETGR